MHKLLADGHVQLIIVRVTPSRLRILCRLLCLMFLAASAMRASGAEDRPRRVLMVHSFGGTAPPFASQATAFESAIKQELGAAVDLDQVSLDNPRYAQPEMEEAFAEFLTKRLAKWQPDLVVPTGALRGNSWRSFVTDYSPERRWFIHG